MPRGKPRKNPLPGSNVPKQEIKEQGEDKKAKKEFVCQECKYEIVYHTDLKIVPPSSCPKCKGKVS